jgi:hypothetical protein
MQEATPRPETRSRPPQVAPMDTETHGYALESQRITVFAKHRQKASPHALLRRRLSVFQGMTGGGG